MFNIGKKMVAAKTVLTALLETCGPQMWITPDAMMHINEYMEQHPEKKPTRRLMRKLEREYYRSKRSGKK
ncbi:hypothetical protein [Turicimonas muris]|uniref:hypothetical protein n=1 Tax=Turicimonas muris TaxID=1796652 RepID=UPI00267023B0|nr:hypothetical protein [Turicimonas muris]